MGESSGDEIHQDSIDVPRYLHIYVYVTHMHTHMRAYKRLLFGTYVKRISVEQNADLVFV